MCILFIYTNPSPPVGGYRLIIASNRDEYYKRPAKKAFRCPETDIIGGRDMEPGREGGMWLGLSTKPPVIKFGALLNVTGEEKKTGTSGRGPLVLNYLKTDDKAINYIQTLQSKSYGAFNLLIMEVTKDTSSTFLHSNSPCATHEYLGEQILAFGNSTPEVPLKKVKEGRDKFEAIVTQTLGKNDLVNNLLELLKCQDLHLPDPELERRAPVAVNFLSSIYVHVKGAGYGTRTHSIVLVDRECNIEFIEHTMREPIDSENPQWDVSVVKAQL